MHANYVLIENVALARQRRRGDHPRSQRRGGKCAVVKSRIALPRLRPTVQVLQFDAQHRGLQFIDAKIPSDQSVKIFRLAAMDAQHPHTFGEFGVMGSAQPGVAKGAEILAWKERKTTNVAD